MSRSRALNIFCSLLIFCSVHVKALSEEKINSDNLPTTEQSIDVPPEDPIQTFNPDAYERSGSRGQEKKKRAANIITTIVLFGISAIALAFVSHNAD